MDPDSVLALCNYSSSSIAVRLLRNNTLGDLIGVIWERWPDLNMQSLTLSYTLSGHCSILLENDLDMLNMISHHLQIKAVRINIVVCRKQQCFADSDLGSSSGTCHSTVESNAEFGGLSELLRYQNDEALLLSDNWSSALRQVGQRFEGGAPEFRIQLSKYAIQEGFQYKFQKNEISRVIAICAAVGCPWRVHASFQFNQSDFYLKEFNNVHTCGGGVRIVKHPRMNSSIVSTVVSGLVQDKPLMRPIEIKQQFKANYGLDISYFHAWIGKEKATKEVHGDESLSFDNLRLYSDSVMESNPCSHTVLDYNKDSRRFQRFFIAFGACIYGFNYCQAIIFLDGTFLKERFKGVFLSTTGKNDNQGIFPIAFAIVDAENEANWKWFLQCLSEILSRERRIIFISDRNKGLLEAVPIVFPESLHGFCFQYLKQNLREKIFVFRGNKYRERLVQLFSKCAYAPTQAAFTVKISEFRREGGDHVVRFLESTPYKHWANAYFPGCRYEELYSNVAESCNSWILVARHLPITQIVDHIRVKIMTMMSERLVVAKKWSTVLCPKMEKKLKDIMRIGTQWNVSRSSEHLFEVHSSLSFSVNLLERTYDCRLWEITGFPCAHAVIAIQKNGKNVYEYCNLYFTTACFLEAYSKPIYPVVYKWIAQCPIDDALVKPPMTRRPPGRPKKKRIAHGGKTRS